MEAKNPQNIKLILGSFGEKPNGPLVKLNMLPPPDSRVPLFKFFYCCEEPSQIKRKLKTKAFSIPKNKYRESLKISILTGLLSPNLEFKGQTPVKSEFFEAPFVFLHSFKRLSEYSKVFFILF